MNREGLVEDWDTVTKLWEYTITSKLTSPRQSNPLTNGLNDANAEMATEMEGMDDEEKPLEETPLFMSEPGHNPPKNRERMLEIAMENWGAPAFWLAKDGVLAAYEDILPSTRKHI